MADALRGGIVINEVLVDPNGASNFDTDGNGTANGRDEFIELQNISGSAIDISGLQFWDAGRANWHTVAPGTTLEAGGRYLVVRNVSGSGSLPTVTGDDIAVGANFGSNVFNNNGDNIVILDPDADSGNGEYIQATYNGDSLDNPGSGSTYAGFPTTATRVGSGEDLGNEIDVFSIQRKPEGGDDFVNNLTPTPGSKNVCFCCGTLILTPTGPRPVETLHTGDLVVTADHGLQAVRWVGSAEISALRQMLEPEVRPIRIAAGALGSGLPARTLRVSRQHKVVLTEPRVSLMFGSEEVFVPAHALVALPGVEEEPPRASFSYHYLMFDAHEVIYAEGVAAESFYLGGEARRAPDEAALAELALLGCTPETLNHPMARPTLRASEARALAQHSISELRLTAH